VAGNWCAFFNREFADFSVTQVAGITARFSISLLLQNRELVRPDQGRFARFGGGEKWVCGQGNSASAGRDSSRPWDGVR
jgi:hypothetical protein